MNDRDRLEIANILEGITSDDTTTIIISGRALLKRHPKILDYFSEANIRWWGIEKPKDKDEP